MRVLGIDPSLKCTGFGLVEKTRGGLRGLCFGHIATSADWGMPRRLERLYTELTAAVDAYRPDCCAVETIYSARNARTALLLGHARGVVMLTAVRAGLPIYEYTPTQIKKAVTGRGGATKEQVSYMVQRLLAIREPITPDDASDALAAAICHLQQGHRSA